MTHLAYSPWLPNPLCLRCYLGFHEHGQFPHLCWSRLFCFPGTSPTEAHRQEDHELTARWKYLGIATIVIFHFMLTAVFPPIEILTGIVDL